MLHMAWLAPCELVLRAIVSVSKKNTETEVPYVEF